jgi:hypothetical protein
VTLSAYSPNVVEKKKNSPKFISRMLHRSACRLTYARPKPYRLLEAAYNTYSELR